MGNLLLRIYMTKIHPKYQERAIIINQHESGKWIHVIFFAKPGMQIGYKTKAGLWIWPQMSNVEIRLNVHFKDQLSEVVLWQCIVRAVGDFFSWGWGIDTSPCTPLVKFEPLMHYCVAPEARALTTTLSAETWYEGWSRSSTDSQSDRDGL